MYKYIYFDLDGTLTQSHFGIFASAEYALSKFGIVENDKERQRLFMGPPLTVSFRDLYGLKGDDIGAAIKYYREYYQGGAYKDAPLYDGIEEMLKSLKDAGYTLMVVTSKPRYLAIKVVEHFGIDKYFYKIVGPDEEKTSAGKEELIEEASREILELVKNQSRLPGKDISEMKLEDIYSEAVMVGDRKFDMEAAGKLGVKSIGALYGYGTMEELTETGADYIAETPLDVVRILSEIQNYN